MRESGEGAGESCEFSDCNVKSDPEGRREKWGEGSGPAVYRRFRVTAGTSRSKFSITGGWAPSPAPVGSVALELML